MRFVRGLFEVFRGLFEVNLRLNGVLSSCLRFI